MSIQHPTRSVNPIVAHLRALRLERGITQVELANRINRPAQHLCDWESGRQGDPCLRNLDTWCNALGLRLTVEEVDE
jgi:transcriptional regulator with XRE-family HTH domain